MADALNSIRVKIDTKKCLASSICTSVAPTAFEVGPDGHVVALDTGSVDEDTLIDAVMSCPTKALSAFAADGTVIWEQ